MQEEKIIFEQKDFDNVTQLLSVNIELSWDQYDFTKLTKRKRIYAKTKILINNSTELQMVRIEMQNSNGL